MTTTTVENRKPATMDLLRNWMMTLSSVEQRLINRMIESGDAYGVYVIYKDSPSFKSMVVDLFNREVN